MSKTVWHLGGWGNNYGDRVLQVATSQIVKDRYNGDLQFVYVDNQKTYWSEALINKLNSEADLLLIGGGGFIFHRPEDNSHSGWQFNIDIENIEKIQVPIAVYGIGYNKFPHDGRNFPQSMWDSVQAVIDKSAVFSVRNQGTYDVLKANEISIDKVEIVPDPGMFIKAFKYDHKCLQTNKLKIGVNWATDRPGQRFASGEEATRKMQLFFNILNEISNKHDAQVYLIDHLLIEDRNYAVKTELHTVAKEIMGDRIIILYNELFEEMFPPFDYTATLFADIYRQMDFVIGMRGHANIISFGQNTPTIGLGRHNKVKWFLEQAGLDQFIIPLQETDGEVYKKMNIMIDRMIEDLDFYKDQMDMRFTELGYIKDAFVDKIIALL